MLAVEIEQPGKRRKVVERKLVVHCHGCGQKLESPGDVDIWAWGKCGEVKVFYDEHRPHGTDDNRTVVTQIVTVEKD